MSTRRSFMDSSSSKEYHDQKEVPVEDPNQNQIIERMDGSSGSRAGARSSRGRQSTSSADEVAPSPMRDRSIRGRASTFGGRKRQQQQQQLQQQIRQQASNKNNNTSAQQQPSRPSLDRGGSKNNSSRWLSDTSHSFKRNLPGRASSAKAPTMPGRPKRSTDSDDEGSDVDADNMDMSDIVNTTRSKSSGDLGRQFGRNSSQTAAASTLPHKSPKALRVPRRRVTEADDALATASANLANTGAGSPDKPTSLRHRAQRRNAPSTRQTPSTIMAASNNDDAMSVTSANTIPTSNTTATNEDKPVVRKDFRPRRRNFDRDAEAIEEETAVPSTSSQPNAPPARSSSPPEESTGISVESKHSVAATSIDDNEQEQHRQQQQPTAPQQPARSHEKSIGDNNSDAADNHNMASSTSMNAAVPKRPQRSKDSDDSLSNNNSVEVVEPMEDDSQKDEDTPVPRKRFTPQKRNFGRTAASDEHAGDAEIPVRKTSSNSDISSGGNDDYDNGDADSGEAERPMVSDNDDADATITSRDASVEDTSPTSDLPPAQNRVESKSASNRDSTKATKRPSAETTQKKFTMKAPRRRYSSSSAESDAENSTTSPQNDSTSRDRSSMDMMAPRRWTSDNSATSDNGGSGASPKGAPSDAAPTPKVDTAPSSMRRPRRRGSDHDDSDSGSTEDTKISSGRQVKPTQTGARAPRRRGSNSDDESNNAEDVAPVRKRFVPRKRDFSRSGSDSDEEVTAARGIAQPPRRRGSDSSDDGEEAPTRRAFAPRKFGGREQNSASNSGPRAPRRAPADSDGSDDDTLSAQRRLGQLGRTEVDPIETQASPAVDSAPSRRAAPQRTASKSLRVTPERATSFQRQAPGRRTIPSEENDHNSVIVLQRDNRVGRVAPGRAVSMSAAGLSSLRVQRMESNTGLRQMASAINKDEDNVAGLRNGPQRNAPSRTISAKALRVTPERSASLRRQIPGRIATSADGPQGEVTLLERSAGVGGRSAPLRAASMSTAPSRRLPERTSSSMRRQAPGTETPGETVGDRAGLLSGMQIRAPPLRAASMGITPQRKAPMRTVSSMRRQALADRSVPAICEDEEGDEEAMPTQPARTEFTRRAPQRTASSMRRQQIAENSVAAIIEEDFEESAPSMPIRSSPGRSASMGFTPQRKAPMRTVSSMRRQRLADNSVAAISEDSEEGDEVSLPKMPVRSSPGRAASMGVTPQRKAPMRTASSMRRQRLADNSVAAISEDGQESFSSLNEDVANPSHSTISAASMGLGAGPQRRAPQRTVSAMRRQRLTENSVAAISEDSEEEESSAPRMPVRSGGTANMGFTPQRKAPTRTASSMRRQRLADSSVAAISEDGQESFSELSDSAVPSVPERRPSAPNDLASMGLGAGPQRRAPQRTASSMRRQRLAENSVAAISEDGGGEMATPTMPMRSAPGRAASMGFTPQRKAPMRTVSSLRRQALADQSVAPIGEDEELSDGEPTDMRSTPLRAASMSVALSGRTGSLASMVPSRSQEPQRNLPARTISAKALRITPERTGSFRRQAPGRSQEHTDEQDGEITVIERVDNGRSAPMRAASMNLASMGRRGPPARSISGMGRQMPLRNDTATADIASQSVLPTGRTAPSRAASMSVVQTGRRLPGRTISAMRRQAPGREAPVRSAPRRAISSKALRVTPERTVSGLRRQAPGRSTAQTDEAAEAGTITVLQRSDDNNGRLAPMRAASMNLSQMRRIASSVSRPDEQINNTAIGREPRRGVPARTISVRASRLAPGDTGSGENESQTGSPGRSIPLRARSMNVASMTSRVQRQESMSGLRAMASMASGRENPDEAAAASEEQKAGSVPAQPSSSLRAFRRRRSLVENPTQSQVDQVAAVADSATGASLVPGTGRRAPPRTSSAAIRRQLPGRTISGMANQRRPPARAQSAALPRRQLPQRTASVRQRIAPARKASGIGSQQLPQDSPSSRQRITPVRAPSSSGAPIQFPEGTINRPVRRLSGMTADYATLDAVSPEQSTELSSSTAPQKNASIDMAGQSTVADGTSSPLNTFLSANAEADKHPGEAEGPVVFKEAKNGVLHASSTHSANAHVGLKLDFLDAGTEVGDAMKASKETFKISHKMAANSNTLESVNATSAHRDNNTVDSDDDDDDDDDASKRSRDSVSQTGASASDLPSLVGSDSDDEEKLQAKGQEYLGTSFESKGGVETANETAAESAPRRMQKNHSRNAGPPRRRDSDSSHESMPSNSADAEEEDSNIQSGSAVNNGAAATVPKRRVSISSEPDAYNADEEDGNESISDHSNQSSSSQNHLIQTASSSNKEDLDATNAITSLVTAENSAHSGLNEEHENEDMSDEGKREEGKVTAESDIKKVREDVMEGPEAIVLPVSPPLSGNAPPRRRTSDGSMRESIKSPTSPSSPARLASSNVVPPRRRTSDASVPDVADLTVSPSTPLSLAKLVASDIAPHIMRTGDASVPGAEEKADDAGIGVVGAPIDDNDSKIAPDTQLSETTEMSDTKQDLPNRDVPTRKTSDLTLLLPRRRASVEDTKDSESTDNEINDEAKSDEQLSNTTMLPGPLDNKSTLSLESKEAVPPKSKVVFKEETAEVHEDPPEETIAQPVLPAQPKIKSALSSKPSKYGPDYTLPPDGALDRTERALALLKDASSGMNARPPARRGSVVSEAGSSPIEAGNSSDDESEMPPLDDALSVRDDESCFTRDDGSMPALDDAMSIRDDESYFTKDDGLSVRDDESMPALDDAMSIRDDESMPALDDVISLKDDESMAALDDATSVRDDESYFNKDDGMSMKDDDSMPALDDDATSAKEDDESQSESMPPLSDIASASVRDDQSMFDDETTVKDDDRSKSVSANDDDDNQGEENQAGISNNQGGIPPIINTCILKKQRIGPIKVSFDGGASDPGAVPPVIDTTISRDRVAKPAGAPSPSTGGERSDNADITVVNPYLHEAPVARADTGEALASAETNLAETNGVDGKKFAESNDADARDTQGEFPDDKVEDAAKLKTEEENDASTADGLQPPSVATAGLPTEDTAISTPATVFNRWG